jgi:hypothetical protein
VLWLGPFDGKRHRRRVGPGELGDPVGAVVPPPPPPHTTSSTARHRTHHDESRPHGSIALSRAEWRGRAVRPPNLGPTAPPGLVGARRVRSTSVAETLDNGYLTMINRARGERNG